MTIISKIATTMYVFFSTWVRKAGVQGKAYRWGNFASDITTQACLHIC